MINELCYIMGCIIKADQVGLSCYMTFTASGAILVYGNRGNKVKALIDAKSINETLGYLEDCIEHKEWLVWAGSYNSTLATTEDVQTK